MAERTHVHQALSTVIDMTVAMQALCRVGRGGGEEAGAIFDAIEACLEKQENAVCPVVEDLQRKKACHG